VIGFEFFLLVFEKGFKGKKKRSQMAKMNLFVFFIIKEN